MVLTKHLHGIHEKIPQWDKLTNTNIQMWSYKYVKPKTVYTCYCNPIDTSCQYSIICLLVSVFFFYPNDHISTISPVSSRSILLITALNEMVSSTVLFKLMLSTRAIMYNANFSNLFLEFLVTFHSLGLVQLTFRATVHILDLNLPTVLNICI